MPLKDYLYIDHVRLDNYEEQISNPRIYDKVPEWKVGLSLTGLSGEGAQKREARSRTVTEKIQLLVDHLEKNKELYRGRIKWSGNRDLPKFRLETCTAIPIRVPRVRHPRSDHSSDELVLWASDDGTSRLFLLQDDGRSDDPKDYSLRSAFNTLLLLYESGVVLSREHDSEYMSGKRARLEAQVCKEKRRSGGSGMRLDRAQDLGFEGEQIYAEVDRRLEADTSLINPHDEKLKQDFAVNPVATLRKLGAHASSSRTIETLYVVRDVYVERADSAEVEPRGVTFGYPIYIASA
jgi:hypothetical protein